MGGFHGKFPVSFLILFLMIISMGLLFNEGESRVGGRIKRDGKIYSNDFLKIQITTPAPSKGIESHNRSVCSSVSWSEENCILGPLSIGKDFPPAVYSQLCPQPYGKFKAHISCNLFIICHNGSLTVNRCPGSTLFNVLAHECVNNSSEINKDCLQSDDRSDIKFITYLTKQAKWMKSAGQVKTSTGETNENDNVKNLNYKSKVKENVKISEISIQGFGIKMPRLEEKLLVESESGYPKEGELCVNSANGIFPHPDSCILFIQCILGTRNVQSCASGTVFNPQTLTCDRETNVPHCKKLLLATTERSKRVDRSLKDPNHIISLADINELLSPEGLSKKNGHKILSRRKRSPSRPRGSSRKCKLSEPEEYIQPHPIYCNMFEICSNGRIVEETCGRGTLFNPLSLVCDFPSFPSFCGNRKVDFSTYDCQKDHEYKAPHPETCDQFIECDFGILQIKTCAPGTLYNREEEKCDYAYKVKCEKPISLEHDTDVNYIPRQSRSLLQQNSLNLACEYNYIAPHPNFCNQFVECEDRRIFIKSCGPGTVFNGEIGQCDWAYNTKLPDPLDCSQYLECERGQYTRKSCLRNTIYNARTKKCVFSQFGAEECKRPTIVNTPPPS